MQDLQIPQNPVKYYYKYLPSQIGLDTAETEPFEISQIWEGPKSQCGGGVNP